MSDLINKRVIYPNGDGGVSVLVPVPDCGLTLEQIIAKMSQVIHTRLLIKLNYQLIVHSVMHGNIKMSR